MHNLFDHTLKKSIQNPTEDALIDLLMRLCTAPEALVRRAVNEYLDEREDGACEFEDEVPVVIGKHSNLLTVKDIVAHNLTSSSISLDLAWKLSYFLDNVLVIHPLGASNRSVVLGHDGPFEKEFVFQHEHHPLVSINLDEFRDTLYDRRRDFYGRGKGFITSKSPKPELFFSLNVAYFSIKNIENIRAVIDWCLSSREMDDAWSSDDAEGAAIFSYMRVYGQCLKSPRICAADFYYGILLERIKTMLTVEQDKKAIDVLRKIASVEEIDEDHFRKLCWKANEEEGVLDNNPFEKKLGGKRSTARGATLFKLR